MKDEKPGGAGRRPPAREERCFFCRRDYPADRMRRTRASRRWCCQSCWRRAQWM